jgi:hypothetical protein
MSPPDCAPLRVESSPRWSSKAASPNAYFDRASLSGSEMQYRSTNNKIRVIQRRAYGLRDEEYLRLKVLTCMLLELLKTPKMTHTTTRRA